MSSQPRTAEARDIAAITALLLREAMVRKSLDPALWAIADDAEARIAASVRATLDETTGPVRHHWLVIEAGGTIVGVTHSVNMPAPPIIDLEGGTAGILLDDCVLASEADTALSEVLLAATERVLRESGAVLFVAACPADWAGRRAFYAAAGYVSTTLYMAKSGLGGTGPTGAVRKATADDIPDIVRLSAHHRAQLQIAQPRFWHTHPEADTRFAGWMGISLSLPDRDMFVSAPSGTIDGYVIAQPCSPLHLPPPHDAARVGLIDDFHSTAFAELTGKIGDSRSASALLDAAEKAFRDRGIDMAIAICPARWQPKAELLQRQGYRTANLWMVKTLAET